MRHRQYGRWVVGAFVVVTLGACSSSTKFSDPAATPATSTTSTTVSAGAVPRSFAELEARLVTKVPVGYIQQPDAVGDTGPSDLAKAVRDDDSPNADKVLRAEHFVRGYQRLWESANKNQVIVFVYEFANVAGARADFLREKVAMRADEPAGAHDFVVPGRPAASTVAVAGTTAGTSAAVVLFTSSVYNAQVVCNGKGEAELQNCVSRIAEDQDNRLR
jgi:hypothetical protein